MGQQEVLTLALSPSCHGAGITIHQLGVPKEDVEVGRKLCSEEMVLKLPRRDEIKLI